MADFEALVPSFVVREEQNLLINPLHPDFNLLQISEPSAFRLDSTDVEMIPFPPFAGKPARFVDKKGRFVEARLKTHPASGIHL